MPDINIAVRFVDDWKDHDPKTRNSSPGTVNGNKLYQIGIQKERRLLKILTGHSIKNYIFVEQGTRNIWYKQSFNNAGVVMMGFSLSLLGPHPKSVPMETYAKAFLDGGYIPELKADADAWLKRNDYVLT